jgi:hypothetical protein
MNASNGVEKKATKVGLHDQKSDFAYWQSQSCELRIAQLEQIRREYHQWKFGAEPRLQRVYKIVKR